MNASKIRAIFGQNLKVFRNRRNWSQGDLAEYADISINYLGDIERGKKWPHPDTLAKLVNALDIGVYELFLEENAEISLNAQEQMNRFMKDVSISINKSMLLSINQSIEYIQKQYKLIESDGLYGNTSRKKIEDYAAEQKKKKLTK